MVTVAGFELVGREAELVRVRGFVDALADRPGAAVIRGDAGIGKTALWRVALEGAEQVGARILVTRCAEAEIPLGFGGLGDLLGDALGAVGRDLPEPHRRALATVVGLEPPADETPDPLVLPRAFLACLRVLAERTPVLLAVDDVQWLDPPSQRILAFAARRLDDARVGILATHRGDADDPLDLRNALDERYTEIPVGPLSIGALNHLIRTRLGVRIPRPTVARVHEASGGNPMFALEFAQLTASAGAPLPVPSSLEELTRERIAALPPEVLPLLAVVAAVERPTVSLVEAVVDDGGRLLDAAEATGAVTSGSDGVVRFTHPLLASAAYAAVPMSLRREMHARFAAAGDDPEERARHVALATFDVDADAAQFLDEAAARARSRGAPDAATTFARHAIRLTPPADGDALEGRRIALATYLIDARQMAVAKTLLDDLLAGEIAGSRRARALLLAFLAESDLEVARRLAEEAVEHAGDDLALRIEALITLGTHPLARGDLEACEHIAREALALAEQLGDPVLLAGTLTCVAGLAERGGHPEPALLERAMALPGTDAPFLMGFPPPRVVLGEQRLLAGDLRGAREVLAAELEAARGWDEQSMTQPVLLSLIDLEWREGNWERAERLVDVLWQHVFDGDPFGESTVCWWQSVLAAARGRLEEARQLADETVRRGEELHLPWLVARGRWLLGFVALSLDEPVGAWEALRGLPERTEVLSRRDSGQAPILPDAVEAGVAAGHLDGAEAVLREFEARARSDDHPWATPAALRCRALLLLARGETDAALATAEQAAAGFAAGGFPLDHGRALLVAGEALRRLGERRRAAEKLEAAKTIFSELGAPLWLARAEKDLLRARPRPRRDRELTNAERRVAALVAAGRTNREVAAQLFTTVGTVEVHLTRIYRKLELRSRTELARLVADGTLVLTDD